MAPGPSSSSSSSSSPTSRITTDPSSSSSSTSSTVSFPLLAASVVTAVLPGVASGVAVGSSSLPLHGKGDTSPPWRREDDDESGWSPPTVTGGSRHGIKATRFTATRGRAGEDVRTAPVWDVACGECSVGRGWDSDAVVVVDDKSTHRNTALPSTPPPSGHSTR